MIRAVVGRGKPIELFRRRKQPPLTAEMKAPTLLAVARHRGTEISNPLPSSEESAANSVRRYGGQPWCLVPATDLIRAVDEGEPGYCRRLLAVRGAAGKRRKLTCVVRASSVRSER
jgi:hypothetical protein